MKARPLWAYGVGIILLLECALFGLGASAIAAIALRARATGRILTWFGGMLLASTAFESWLTWSGFFPGFPAIAIWIVPACAVLYYASDARVELTCDRAIRHLWAPGASGAALAAALVVMLVYSDTRVARQKPDRLTEVELAMCRGLVLHPSRDRIMRSWLDGRGPGAIASEAWRLQGSALHDWIQFNRRMTDRVPVAVCANATDEAAAQISALAMTPEDVSLMTRLTLDIAAAVAEDPEAKPTATLESASALFREIWASLTERQKALFRSIANTTGTPPAEDLCEAQRALADAALHLDEHGRPQTLQQFVLLLQNIDIIKIPLTEVQ